MKIKALTIKYRRLSPLAHLPSYATPHSAGMDLHAAVAKKVTLQPGEIRLVPTGLALEIPTGYEGQVRPRSGLALKAGISIVNAPGTIDSDYRGEVGVILINLGKLPLAIAPGDRIAQLVISPVIRAALREAVALAKTKRGAGGFGHTGLKKPAAITAKRKNAGSR